MIEEPWLPNRGSAFATTQALRNVLLHQADINAQAELLVATDEQVHMIRHDHVSTDNNPPVLIFYYILLKGRMHRGGRQYF